MLHPNYSDRHEPQVQRTDRNESFSERQTAHFDLQTELKCLENLILKGTRIPLTKLIFLKPSSILDRLNKIRQNLPQVLTTAVEIVDRQQAIISEAQNYARQIVKSAEEKATEIVSESAIVRQAELQAAKIELQAEQECDRLRQQEQAIIQQWREEAIAECQAIQAGADNYADQVLGDMEQQLKDMLSVIQKGRQQLDSNSSS